VSCFWYQGEGSNDLNATVRGTVACRRLDGGNTIIFAFGKNANRSRSAAPDCIWRQCVTNCAANRASLLGNDGSDMDCPTAPKNNGYPNGYPLFFGFIFTTRAF